MTQNNVVEVKSLEFQNFASTQVETVGNLVDGKDGWLRGMQRKKTRDEAVRSQKNSWVQEFKNRKK